MAYGTYVSISSNLIRYVFVLYSPILINSDVLPRELSSGYPFLISRFSDLYIAKDDFSCTLPSQICLSASYWSVLIFRQVEENKSGKNMYFATSLLSDSVFHLGSEHRRRVITFFFKNG